MILASQYAVSPQDVMDLFNDLAPHYDQAASRFYPFSADAMLSVIQPKPGQKILDVGTGTGTAAIAFAQTMRRQGRVIAVDFSDAMIAKAIQNSAKMALENVDFFIMDAQALEFKSAYFDHVISGFSLYYLSDMEKALRSWCRVTKPGGKILCSGFSAEVFGELLQRLKQLLQPLLQQSSVSPLQPLLFSERLGRPQQWSELMQEVGLKNIEVKTGQFGYHLGSVSQWWDVVWNSDLRLILQQLDPQRLHALKEQHLNEIAALVQPEGLWLDVKVNFCVGEV